MGGVAGILGCTANQLAGLRSATFATGVDLAMRITQSLVRPAVDFAYRPVGDPAALPWSPNPGRRADVGSLAWLCPLLPTC